MMSFEKVINLPTDYKKLLSDFVDSRAKYAQLSNWGWEFENAEECVTHVNNYARVSNFHVKAVELNGLPYLINLDTE